MSSGVIRQHYTRNNKHMVCALETSNHLMPTFALLLVLAVVTTSIGVASGYKVGIMMTPLSVFSDWCGLLWSYTNTFIHIFKSEILHRHWGNPWWRHEMGTFATLLALYGGNPPVTGGSYHKALWRGAFDVFFDLRLNKRLSKLSTPRWFEMPPRLFWRHCNAQWNNNKEHWKMNHMN